jgi:phospholipase/carboxylesterase
VPGFEHDLHNRKDFPVCIAHGSVDPVISVEFAREARDTLTAAGADVTYRESPMPHTIDPRSVPDIARWVGERLAGT